MAETDALGVHSHGTKNLRQYIAKIKAGGIDANAEPTVVKAFGAVAVMDAGNAIGMAAAYKGMLKAICLARENGIGYVCMRNSCHFGAAGYYANMAASEGMIGIAMSNTDPVMAVPGAKGTVLGNNPLAYAVPAETHNTIFMDIAMSATAALKVIQAKKEHREIPETWLADDKGVPTTDPQFFGNGGALLPIGAHKGYGLSFLVDVLTGILSGGAITSEIPSWCFALPVANRASHAFIALNISAFQELGFFKARVDGFADYVKSAPKARGNNEIFLPGEMEWLKKSEADLGGIPLPEDVAESLALLSEESGEKINWA